MSPHTRSRTEKAYFESAYARSPEVFGAERDWYEQRKRNVLLASLPRARYGVAFEPGCGVAQLSLELLHRCDCLVMMDWSSTALQHARARINRTRINSCVIDAGAQQRAELLEGAIPDQWPEYRRFDLIVISEVLYYLPADQIEQCAQRAYDSLRPYGDLVLLHWLHASPDYPMTGRTAHQIFLSAWPIEPAVQLIHEEQNFMLTVIGKNHDS